MNREQAIKAVADKTGLSGPSIPNLVDAMVAVGVLKLEPESLVKLSCVWPGGSQACCRLDTMIEALRMAGYEVCKHGLAPHDIAPVACGPINCSRPTAPRSHSAWGVPSEQTKVESHLDRDGLTRS
jgi:hypothetical protein